MLLSFSCRGIQRLVDAMNTLPDIIPDEASPGGGDWLSLEDHTDCRNLAKDPFL